MTKLSKNIGLIVTCVLLCGVICFLSGCKGDVSFSTASLSEATICISVDQITGKPVEKGDVFTSETAEIYCSVKLSSAPEETQVLAQWIYIKGEVEGVTDHKIDETSLNTDGTKYLWYSITRPDTGFPKGEYACKIFLNAKEKFSVPFTVQ
ncbi:hypothetical protein ACFLT9_12575 [Acidobacteriota bacterium]